MAVVVDVGDLACVGGGVEVVEGDAAVVVGVDEGLLEGGGDFGLVDPGVEVEVGVGVLHAGVDVGDDDAGAAVVVSQAVVALMAPKPHSA
jgi:hypothetical protein